MILDRRKEKCGEVARKHQGEGEARCPLWEHLFPPPPTCWFCSSPAGGRLVGGVGARVCGLPSPVGPDFSAAVPPVRKIPFRAGPGPVRGLRGAVRASGSKPERRSVQRFCPGDRRPVQVSREGTSGPPPGTDDGGGGCGMVPLPDWVTFVPLHPSRLKDRGFNQAELLARIVSAHLNRPLVPLLKRIRPTEPQSQKSRRERLVALRGAFAPAADRKVRGKWPGPASSSSTMCIRPAPRWRNAPAF